MLGNDICQGSGWPCTYAPGSYLVLNALMYTTVKYQDMSGMGPLHSANMEVKQDIHMNRQLEKDCNFYLYLISKMDFK